MYCRGLLVILFLVRLQIQISLSLTFSLPKRMCCDLLSTCANSLVQEGLTIVENRTSDIIQETRKHIRKKPGNSVGQNQETNHSTTVHQSQLRNQMSPKQTDQELQLKASRDVRWQLCITFLCGKSNCMVKLCSIKSVQHSNFFLSFFVVYIFSFVCLCYKYLALSDSVDQIIEI